jgi:guanylate kinase
VIVSGPSGTGKTTALTSWAARTSGTSASATPRTITGCRSST